MYPRTLGRSIAPMTFADLVRARAAEVWEQSITPTLYDYIAIPNVSEAFDADWKAHGYMDAAVTLITDWCRARPIPGLTVEVVQLDGRSPLILMEIPPTGGASAQDTVLLYGHLDKQPEMSGWRDGLGPWTPVREGDRLYGRGGADDGYAAFASLTAIEAVHAAGGAHTRCIVMIEASEESGSPDLPAYVEHLLHRIGTPSLVVCLDSGCANYDRMWVTTSLRGLVGFTLTVDVLDEGVHSGDASGIVPSSFRILPRAARPDRRCHEWSSARARDARRHPRRSRRSGCGHRAGTGIPGEQRLPPSRQYPADGCRCNRAVTQPHVAANVVVHRRRRFPSA